MHPVLLITLFTVLGTTLYNLIKFVNTTEFSFSLEVIKLQKQGPWYQYLILAFCESKAKISFLPSFAKKNKREFYIKKHVNTDKIEVYDKETGLYFANDYISDYETTKKFKVCIPEHGYVYRYFASLLVRDENKKVINKIVENYYDSILSERENDLKKQFEKLEKQKSFLQQKQEQNSAGVRIALQEEEEEVINNDDEQQPQQRQSFEVY